MKYGRLAAAVFAYCFLAVFLWLISAQIYRWFREGDWTHIGITDGMRIVLVHAGITDADPGRLGSLLHWLETPVDWLGLYKVLEVIPASFALFVLSILGNFVAIYCQDRAEQRQQATAPTVSVKAP